MEEQKPTQTSVDEVIERAQSENTKIEATKISASRYKFENFLKLQTSTMDYLEFLVIP